jgi:hypothetical protein
VTNSLSKLGDEILEIRQDITKLSSTLREELEEFKNIMLSMSETKNASSPRNKAHQQSQNSDSVSASSIDEKMLDSDTSGTDKYKVINSDRVKRTDPWDSMCEDYQNIDLRKERHICKSQSIYQGSS